MGDTYEIRQFGDPALKEKSLPATPGDDDLKALIVIMKKIVSEADGVGLAAPQIGVLKRIVVMELNGNKSAFLNPRIVWKSEEMAEEEEGCLSLPGIKVKIPRNLSVKIEAESIKGKTSTIDAEGLIARIFQHEIDHLDGILILDRASKTDRKRILKELGLLPIAPIK